MAEKKTIKKVDDSVVDAEARKLLLNQQAWENSDGVSSITITDKMVTQPRAKVGKQIQEIVRGYLPESSTTQTTTGEGVVVTVPEADMKPVRHAVKEGHSKERFEQDMERRQQSMERSRLLAAAASQGYAQEANGQAHEGNGHAATATATEEGPAAAKVSKATRRRPADFRTHDGDEGADNIEKLLRGKRAKTVDPGGWQI
jgi:hypothetical protein